MYALIYDDHSLDEPQKKIISTHGNRKESDKALLQRQIHLGKRVWECNTRIVWTDKAVVADDCLILENLLPGVQMKLFLKVN